MSANHDAIAGLYNSGLRLPEIARRLGLAPTTVSYHVGRLRAAGARKPPAAETRPEPYVSHAKTRLGVERLLSEGVSRAEAARRLGVSKATVSYHARRLDEPIDQRCARRYDWEAVQRFYDEGHSVRECIRTFGFSSASWYDAVKRGAVVARPAALPIAELLVADTYRGRYNLKVRLIKEGLKQNQCERCGLIEWRGEPLTLALHHVNGRRHDNRLENLELLCPNCHSQTDNYAGRNGRGVTPRATPPPGPSTDPRADRADRSRPPPR